MNGRILVSSLELRGTEERTKMRGILGGAAAGKKDQEKVKGGGVERERDDFFGLNWLIEIKDWKIGREGTGETNKQGFLKGRGRRGVV